MRARSTRSGRAVCGAAFVILWLRSAAALALDPPPITEAPTADAGDGVSEMVLELRLNGQGSGEACIVLIDAGNALWLERRDFARLRLRPPPVTPRVLGDREYLPLAAVPGARVALDSVASTADIRVPATAFLASTQSLQLPAEARAAPSSTTSSRRSTVTTPAATAVGDLPSSGCSPQREC
jgi:hypothetical protein